MTVIIFSIDGQHRAPTRAQFEADFEAITGSEPIKCIGSYEGETEHSWLVLKEDFQEFFTYDNMYLTELYLSEQESVLHVTQCNKMYASLHYGDGRPSVALGSMHQISAEESWDIDNWTYRPDMDIYWTTRKGNPDRNPSEDARQDKIDKIINEIMDTPATIGHCALSDIRKVLERNV